MVLLDPSLDAPAAPVSARPCGPPREPPADRLGGDELSPAGGDNRRGRHPRARLPHPDPCRGARSRACDHDGDGRRQSYGVGDVPAPRSEEHTSELQSLMRISYAVIGLKKKKIKM